MTDIEIPANTVVQFDPDTAGNIVQNTDQVVNVMYSFDNDDTKKWFVLPATYGAIRVDSTVYFKHSASGTVTLASDKA
ncbi:hypothetical protein [Hydrogenimonas urashimensis]|uniref:hypothetical protein n=1 Tax=Hydrogenimonas urashimensis TaxID=2740515 RepID=UPI001915A742|nr:hypothetical protein [Hydrogenimonas urashimensis]